MKRFIYIALLFSASAALSCGYDIVKAENEKRVHMPLGNSTTSDRYGHVIFDDGGRQARCNFEIGQVTYRPEDELIGLWLEDRHEYYYCRLRVNYRGFTGLADSVYGVHGIGDIQLLLGPYNENEAGNKVPNTYYGTKGFVEITEVDSLHVAGRFDMVFELYDRTRTITAKGVFNAPRTQYKSYPPTD